MDEEGMPLTEFVNQSITKIMAGLPNGIKLKDSIDFELSVVLTKGVDGGFAFNVLKLGANKKTEEFQKIRFSPILKATHKYRKDKVYWTIFLLFLIYLLYQLYSFLYFDLRSLKYVKIDITW